VSILSLILANSFFSLFVEASRSFVWSASFSKAFCSFARLALVDTTSLKSLLCLDWKFLSYAAFVTRVASSAASSSLEIVASDGLGSLAAAMVDGILRESTFQSSFVAIVDVSELG
jgi:hypothetical protein